MKYLDREGKAIHKDVWKFKFFHDRQYGQVKLTVVEDWRIETSWVGIAANFEASPKIFCTLIHRRDKLQRKVPDTWQPTEEDALDAHATAVLAVREYLKEPKEGSDENKPSG